LERFRRVLGEYYPSTLACSLNLAVDLRVLGRIQEADKIHADRMARFRTATNPRTPQPQPSTCRRLAADGEQTLTRIAARAQLRLWDSFASRPWIRCGTLTPRKES
jgi:hypothetical protein